MEQVLTFDQLPQAVTLLTKEISELKQLILNRGKQQQSETPEQLLSIQEAAKFLNLSVPTIYSKVSKGELPVMKRSKRLYFSRAELLEYIKTGRKKTNAEIATEANNYLSQKQR